MIVAGVDELVRAAGLDIEVVVVVVEAPDALGQDHVDRARIAVAHGELAQMGRRGEVGDDIRPVRVAREPDAIGPGARAGDADAVVHHAPGDAQRFAAGSGPLGGDRFDLQIRVRDRHDIDVMPGAGGVVRLRGIFEYLGFGIADDEQLVASARRGRKLDMLGPAIAAAGVEDAIVAELADDPVVAVADGVVAGKYHAVSPGGGLARPGALIGDGPGDVERGGIVDDLCRRGNGGNR